MRVIITTGLAIMLFTAIAGHNVWLIALSTIALLLMIWSNINNYYGPY